MLAGSAWPVFFTRAAQHVPASANVYLDVSGSMQEYIPWMYGVINGMMRYMAPKIYLFSNKIVEITRAELQQGQLRSTGGTDFDCVIKHLAAARVPTALVITDGMADISVPELAAKVKCSVNVIGVTIGRQRQQSLHRFTRKIYNIDPDSGGMRT